MGQPNGKMKSVRILLESRDVCNFESTIFTSQTVSELFHLVESSVPIAGVW